MSSGRKIRHNQQYRKSIPLHAAGVGGKETGEVFEIAKQARLAAREGNASADDARSAFVAAAQEAGIFFFKPS